MNMEFDEDEENLKPIEETGLTARLGKKVKKEAKDKGEKGSWVVETFIINITLQFYSKFKKMSPLVQKLLPWFFCFQ